MSKKPKKLRIQLPQGELANDYIQPIDEKEERLSDVELMNPDELFTDSMGDGQNNIAKELFNPKNPKIKSEFTDAEILLICRLYTLSKKYYERMGTFLLKDTLDEMVMLRISKDRKSRAEFVETNREAQKNKEMGFLGRMLGGGSQI